ncbi:MAG: hypothetical protein JNL57_01285 [Bacteroidetes bacterium]|nr:hypothetical protein [Bacteroidota bacterium]
MANWNYFMAEALKMLEHMPDSGHRSQCFEKMETASREIEQLKHQILHQLGKTYITPIPREDVLAISVALNHTCHALMACGRSLLGERCAQFAGRFGNLTGLLAEMATTLKELTVALEHRNYTQAHSLIFLASKFKHEIMNACDTAMVSLYEAENDFRSFMLIREILYQFESAARQAGNLATAVENVILCYTS